MMKKLIVIATFATAIAASPASASECCKNFGQVNDHAISELSNADANVKLHSAAVKAKIHDHIANDDALGSRKNCAKKMKAYLYETKSAENHMQSQDVKCHECKKTKVENDCDDCTNCKDCADCDDCDSCADTQTSQKT